MARGAKGDINLIVDLELARVDAIGRRIHDEMAQAGGAGGRSAGKRFSDEFTKTVSEKNGKIARAYDRVVDSISRATENEEKLRQQRELTKQTSSSLEDAEQRLIDVRKDGVATDEDVVRATDEVRRARAEHSREMSKQISLIGQNTRLTQQHASALDAVRKAQSAFSRENSAQQGLLTAGKFISAARAAIIPFAAVETFAVLVEIGAMAASAAQSLLLIPAAATAAGAAMATLAIGTSGFSDTIDALVSGDLEKFATLIQKLSPNAQQAALSIQALWPAFTELKNATQDALFTDVGPMLNTLADQYLPTIQRLTTGVASAINDAGKQVFKQLMTPETQQSVAVLVDNITEAFHNLTPAIAPLVNAFAKLAEVGSGVLPEIAAAAARAAQSFSNFIDQAAASGELDRWLRDGLNTVSLLGQGAWELGKAFMSLAPTAEKILPDIVRALSSIKDIMPIIGPLAIAFGPAFGVWEVAIRGAKTSMEIFGDLVAGVGKAIEAVMTRLGPLIDATLAPLRTTIALYNSSPLSRLVNIPQIPSSAAMGTAIGAAATVYGKDGSIPGAGPDAAPGIGGMIGNFITPTRSSGFGTLPTAGLPGFPSGGYGVPAPPPDKGAGGGKSAEPPFSADPSQWSVDAIPVGALPNGLASNGGLTPNAANLNNIVSSMFPGMPSAGGWRPPDGFNEHSSGQAVDFMVGNDAALGQAINDFILQNAKALGVQYTIWQQMNRYPDGTMTPNIVPGGDPTKNHMDHVHARVLPGPATAGGIAFPGQGAGAAAGGMMGGVNVVDPEKVMRAEFALQTAKNDVEQKRLRLLELEAKGNASQRELLTARNDVSEAENRYRLADLDLQQARQGKYKELDGKVKGAARGIGEIGAALADDFGLSEGLPGIAKWLTTFMANMAFAPAIGALSAQAQGSPIQGGSGALGMFGAQNIASGLTPLGFGNVGAPMAASIGPAPLGGGLGMPLTSSAAYTAPSFTTPNTSMAPGATPAAPGGVGGIGTGAGFPGLGGPPQGLIGATPGPATPNTSQAPTSMGGGGFQGLGGLPMAGMQMAGMAADLFMPGAGQAAQTGIQVMNRTAGYIGQLAAIGVGGLMETFLPNNSETGDPSKSWIGRIASGLAGARPALPNTAGSQAPAQAPNPQQPGQGGQGGPTVSVGAINNYTPDGGNAIANRIGQMTAAGYASGGKR